MKWKEKTMIVNAITKKEDRLGEDTPEIIIWTLTFEVKQVMTYAPYLKWRININKLSETLNSNQLFLKLNWLHIDINLFFLIKGRIEFSIHMLLSFVLHILKVVCSQCKIFFGIILRGKLECRRGVM